MFVSTVTLCAAFCLLRSWSSHDGYMMLSRFVQSVPKRGVVKILTSPNDETKDLFDVCCAPKPVSDKDAEEQRRQKEDERRKATIDKATRTYQVSQLLARRLYCGKDEVCVAARIIWTSTCTCCRFTSSHPLTESVLSQSICDGITHGRCARVRVCIILNSSALLIVPSRAVSRAVGSVGKRILRVAPSCVRNCPGNTRI